MSSLFLMITITDRRSTDGFLQLYKSHGVTVSMRTVGSGTAVQETLSTLGLEKTEKAVLLAVVTAESWQKIQKDLRRKMQIDVPGTGIAFIVPLSSIGGKRALMFLTEHQPLTWKEESTLKDTRYELLLVVANQGYTGSIMDAARTAGAGGLSGRGAGERKGAGAHRQPHQPEEHHHEGHYGGGKPQGGHHRVLAAGDRYRRSAADGRGRSPAGSCPVTP